MTETTSARPKRRDRETLRQAVYAAVLEELVEHGYGGMTIEGVAAHAGAAKTSVYRHWPTKEELVLDTLHNVMPAAVEPPNTGSIRGDCLVMLRSIRESITGPAGPVIGSLLGERTRHPQIAGVVVDTIFKPRQRLMLDALHQAAARGEIAVGAVSLIPVLAATGLMLQHYLQQGTAPSEQDITDFVDGAILPIVGASG
ncbi:TetR/AcrR family transcriptional regulator [Pseudonocardia sp. CA-107938]|uniref:TetR/AcrR family transcriptional regulator n=1 Tax=Pseudonocardia sp. CA-107938 TaxID=3240021 RepID=UPI003D8EBB8F